MASTIPSCISWECYEIPDDLVASLPVCEETVAPSVATTTTASFDDVLAANGLPSSGTWSYDWFAFSVPDEKFEGYVSGYGVGGVLLGIILVSLSYIMFDRVWMSRSPKFRSLPNEQQIVVIQHSIEAFFLALFFIPMSWAMLSSNFQVPYTEKFDKIRNSFIGCYMVWIVTTYFVELAGRYKTVRSLVLVHHLCAAADALLPLFVMTLVNIRCASVLTYFITFEAPVFCGLVMYRLFPLNEWTPTVIRFGMWVFGLSRPLQMAWILMIVIEHWNTSEAWQCIIQVLFGVFFSCLQLYTLVIHNGLLKKCLKMQAGEQKEALGDGTDLVGNIDYSQRRGPAFGGHATSMFETDDDESSLSISLNSRQMKGETYTSTIDV